jgi:MerR family transcriptional regulator, light-induced transcriptional regulator
MSLGFAERTDIADAVRRLREDAARQVTDTFLSLHPDWVVRYGERARRRGIEDALFHIDFLAGAVETGSGEAFASYTAWAARVLRARHIEPVFLKENLRQVCEAVTAGLPPSQAAFVGAIVDEGCRACDGADEGGPSPSVETLLAPARETFLQAILAGHRTAAVNVALLALAERPPVDVYVLVIQEALYAVGRLWESNRITVAQEHMATAVAQFVVAQMFRSLPAPATHHGTIVLTGVEGERHQLGAHMVADLLESEGWDVRFLGVDLPQAGVVQTVEELRPRILAISATMLFNVPKVTALVSAVRARLGGDAPHVLLGGSAFRSAGLLWQDVGANGCALDLRQALTLTRAWAA